MEVWSNLYCADFADLQLFCQLSLLIWHDFYHIFPSALEAGKAEKGKKKKSHHLLHNSLSPLNQIYSQPSQLPQPEHTQPLISFGKLVSRTKNCPTATATQCSQCGNGIRWCIHRKASWKFDSAKSGVRPPTPAPTSYEHKVINYNPANLHINLLFQKVSFRIISIWT